ncbi:MAG: response regulator transcription factor [Niastella sp.]|nr:response regulator transcription factor [Niastella sp.]
MEEKRVLIVEDEHKIADTLKTGLMEHGYHVEVAYDGKIGERLYFAHSFNLVVLDINLPGINGYELCRIIRNHNAPMPVIMLTALGRLNDKIKGYDSGADDYLVKPFEFQELLVKIRVLLKRTMSQHLPVGNLLQADDLIMNLDTKEVRRGDDSITLTVKEFQLLEFLIRNRNRVVSRADISVNVWDIDFDTNSNVIDVYINYLRNKVDKKYEKKLILTQTGMGYMLKAA